ncbi:DciA family protein [Pseudoalteromonas sp. MMG024]|uniref:DciA family protein n=1 Tax=Pseudoalteromonas sp. MMG024 TaxID=2909980 RepID=UPI001F3D49D5|nr:DciA family protein [Pseudoalteromonas sp. MMG024]MCF6459355.1 DciA family protein [Pseudoalteromonas sp. MMG024]
MAKNRFAPKPLGDVLTNLPNRLQQFSNKNQENKQLQSLLEQILDQNMLQKCTIANYQDGTLVLNAQSAAVAMRLNYMKMSLLSDFRRLGLPELCQIKIQTSPRSAKSLQANQQQQQSQEKKRLTKSAQQSLLEVAQHAPDSLRLKLEKLAKLADR